MLNKTQQKQLEAKTGPLDLIPPPLRDELVKAFLKVLQIEKEKKRRREWKPTGTELDVVNPTGGNV